MAIRRTREDKQKARTRREQVDYTWKPKEEKTTAESVKLVEKTKLSSPAPQSVERDYFRKDIRRALLSLGVVLLLLFLAWYWLR